MSIHAPHTGTRRASFDLQPVADLLATERSGYRYDDSFLDWAQDAPVRQARLDALWEMSPSQRVAAMRRGELSADLLAAWAALFPDEVPRIGGVPEWLAGAPAHALFR